MTNYIKLKPGLLYQNYVFFDVEQYYATIYLFDIKSRLPFSESIKKKIYRISLYSVK